MSFLHRSEIETLVRASGGPCISLFMPAVRAGDTQQNPIRFKNLMRTAGDRLTGWGLRDAEAGELLDPLRGLAEDRTFWEHQSDGLALFRSPDLLRTYRLPLSFSELAVVEDRFHLKPLFPLLSGDGHFYILAISQKNVRLISATRHSAEEIDLSSTRVPRSLTEALGELIQRYTQYQGGAGSKGGVSRAPIFFGHSSGDDHVKDEIVGFLRRVDQGLRALPMERDAPVVLAGVESLLARYREASELPNIQEEGLAGNAEGLRPEELQEAAWPIVEPFFLADRRRAAERFGELAGTGRASSLPEEILPAAHDGRIEALFTARGVRLWGSYDPQERQIHLAGDQDRQTEGTEDLLDLAAVQTYLNRGAVFAVERHEVPDGQAVAAVFRY